MEELSNDAKACLCMLEQGGYKPYTYYYQSNDFNVFPIKFIVLFICFLFFSTVET